MLLATAHADPALGALVLLAAIWLAAKAGGELATRLKLPTVVGELGAGMAMAACHRAWQWFPDVAGDPSADLFAAVGVVLLMFSVGLESTVPQMLKVGLPALRVAVAGVIMPVLLGLGAAFLLIPGGVSLPVALFIGACLCATSVGISARVLSERNAGSSQEGRVILGAAVIDDVLGLLVLVLVSGMALADRTGGGTPWRAVGGTLALAVGFLGVALSLGRLATPHLVPVANLGPYVQHRHGRWLRGLVDDLRRSQQGPFAFARQRRGGDLHRHQHCRRIVEQCFALFVGGCQRLRRRIEQLPAIAGGDRKQRPHEER